MALARVGRGTALGVGKESTWGTAVARAIWVRAISTGLQQRSMKKPRPDLHSGASRARTAHYVERIEAGGPISWHFGFEGQGLIWQDALWATPSTTGPSAGIYTHTYRQGTTQPTGLTIEELRGTDPSSNVSRVYEGCMVDSLEWSLSAGGLLTCRAEIIAELHAAEGSAGTATFTANEIEANHANGSTVSFNSVNYTVRSAVWRVKNSLARRQLVGSNYTDQPQPSDFASIEGEIVIETTSDTIRAAQVADTTSDVVMTITGTGSRSVAFTLDNAYIDDVADPIENADVITQKVKFMGQFVDSSNTGFSLVIANTQSSATAA